ncbi:hypothetical protein SAMN05216343_1246 [Oscillibacter sp. PC13]|nr:hypothetical protein SAMN05216343_1246 [Oscillibacter sp. PC13]
MLRATCFLAEHREKFVNTEYQKESKKKLTSFVIGNKISNINKVLLNFNCRKEIRHEDTDGTV